MNFDAIIIGGSYAGLSAALQLARARRKVLVMDSGQRRNRFLLLKRTAAVEPPRRQHVTFLVRKNPWQ